MKYNGCIIEIGSDKIMTLNMHEYLERLSPIDLSRNRRKEVNECESEKEIAE